MVFKKIFGGKSTEPIDYNIDELIVLRRYDEAVLKLKDKIKLKDDVHDVLKLAECYIHLGQLESAIEFFLLASEKYAVDGFYDRALAIIRKVIRYKPTDERLLERQKQFGEFKDLEIKRRNGLKGFELSKLGGLNSDLSVVEFDNLWRTFSRTAFIRNQNSEQIERIFSATSIVFYRQGELIYEKSILREELTIIIRGEVEASLDPEPGRNPLRKFGLGHIIGESCLFKRRPMLAYYRALTNVSALTLGRTGLEVCLAGNNDPRSFLNQLRGQRKDEAVAKMVHALL